MERIVKMRRYLFLLPAVASIFGIFGAMRTLAQGVIVPIICDVRPCRPMPRPPVPLPNVLPVSSVRLDTKIVGQVATTHVEQIFRNDTDMRLEGTYFFPIPEARSIVEFAIWENGKKLVGEVRSREEARRIYNEIVRRQRDPGLLEYAGKDLFQASIFPIEPRSDKKLELTYSEVLRADSGTVAYRYPLGMGRNIWRPASPEPALNSQSPQQVGTFSGSIEINANGPIRNIYSPTHQIDTKLKGDKSANVSFEAKNNTSDLQLFYSLSDKDFGMSLITYREPGKDGYFLLTLSPKDKLTETEYLNKDIVFVIDTSGSMADAGKMEKARKALLFGIKTLRDGDRFNVVSFAGEEHLMEAGLIAANDEGKRRGTSFVERLRPSGGTNINDTLIASLKLFEKNDRPKMLVFMTDGLPNISETKPERIIANLQAAKGSDIRIFPFGFGYDVNTMLLDRIGSENSGISDYVQPTEDLEVKVSNFFARVSSPVLADLDIDFGPVLPELMYPRKPTDMFRGTQMTIIGRYRNTSDLRGVVLKLTGRVGRETRKFEYPGLDFPARSEANDFLPRLWASRRVGWLLEQIRNNGESKETRDEVVELASKYGLVTPYTSYLATDGSMANVRSSAPSAAVAIGGGSRKAAEKSGADAVKLSVQQNTMQNSVQVFSADGAGADENTFLIGNTATNRFIANKSFANESGVWVDVEFNENAKLPVVTVKFGSNEYFDLAAKETGLAPYLSLGEQVTVVYKGKVFRVIK